LVESWQLLKSLHVLVVDAEIISTLQQRIHGDSTDATSSASDEEEKLRRSCSATQAPLIYTLLTFEVSLWSLLCNLKYMFSSG
jgi:hypothetical protein